MESYIDKKHHIRYYSNVDGNYIHDAITNARYPWKVGSLNERRFFKVIDCAGNNNLGFAYYESPEAYMNHMNVELDEDIIDRWNKRMVKLYSNQ